MLVKIDREPNIAQIYDILYIKYNRYPLRLTEHSQLFKVNFGFYILHYNHFRLFTVNISTKPTGFICFLVYIALESGLKRKNTLFLVFFKNVYFFIFSLLRYALIAPLGAKYG
jgi:accessory gene regulator protein AgrB